MLLWNEFTHDARVLKVAQTLAGAGHEVNIVAVSAGSRPPGQERLAERIVVVRVPREVRGLLDRVLAPRRWWRDLRSHARHWLHHRLGFPAPAPVEPVDVRSVPERHLIHLIEELAVVRGMVRTARGLRPDVIHANDANTLLPTWLALDGRAFVYDAHEISADLPLYGGRRWLVHLAELLIGSAADLFIATTELRARYHQDRYGHPRALVLQNRPRREDPTPTDLREQLGLPASAVLAVYAGGLQHGRGLGTLVRAVADCPRELHLVMLGHGVQGPELQELVDELALGERVHIRSMVALDALIAHLAAADLGVQPLRPTSENHRTTDSNKLFEYVMAGLPVVASDLPEIRRVVLEHGVGLLIEPGSVEALAGALSDLVQDPAARERMAAASRRARRVLCWENQEDALVAAYGALPC